MKTLARPRAPRHCRRRPTKWLKDKILALQGFACLGCDTRLQDVEFDHVIPLGIGGDNLPDNWAALCARCHRKKTVADIRIIAKAKRQRRFHETGRSRAAAKSGGFDKMKRRHLNGAVTTRCECPRCREGAPSG